MIGDMTVYHKFNKRLPFLLKILSIAQPLSLQAHPDRELAIQLHQKDSKNYPDPNHKPELMIALTHFEMLCDFRPFVEISSLMQALPCLRRVVGEHKCNAMIKAASKIGSDNSDEQKKALADCFKSLMYCKSASIADASKDLLTKHESRKTLETMHLLNLIELLVDLYPGDPGIFAPFFMNYIKLNPGQGVYLKPKKLHGYIKGECIECMACSDNVVRAGLTTKFRDVETLLKMLDYEAPRSSKELLLNQNERAHRSITTFGPSEDFKVDKIVIMNEDLRNGSYTLPSVSSGSFFLFLEGNATAKNFLDLGAEHKLQCGSSGFVPPKIALQLNDVQGKLILYRAYC